MTIVHTAQTFAGPPPIMALLLDSGIIAKLDDVIGFDRLGYDGGQIALRKAGNASEPELPEPHIDGLPTRFNGVSSRVLFINFTALVGIYLSPVRTEFAGNFTVWPRLAPHFGSSLSRAGTRSPAQWHAPHPAWSTRAIDDRTRRCGALSLRAGSHRRRQPVCDRRYTVYFRLWLKDLGDHHWHFMTHISDGWRI